MRRSVLALIGLGVLIATPAAAETTTIRVPVAQSDLATPEAVDALYQRVVEAADSVCRAASREVGVLSFSQRACRVETVEAAITDADLAPLSSRHEQAHEAMAATPGLQALAR